CVRFKCFLIKIEDNPVSLLGEPGRNADPGLRLVNAMRDKTGGIESPEPFIEFMLKLLISTKQPDPLRLTQNLTTSTAGTVDLPFRAFFKQIKADFSHAFERGWPGIASIMALDGRLHLYSCLNSRRYQRYPDAPSDSHG